MMLEWSNQSFIELCTIAQAINQITNKNGKSWGSIGMCAHTYWQSFLRVGLEKPKQFAGGGPEVDARDVFYVHIKQKPATKVS